MQETWVWSLGREDPTEKEMATHSSILTWKSRGAWWATVRGATKSQTRLSNWAHICLSIHPSIHLSISNLLKYININIANLKKAEKHKKEMIFYLKIVTRNIYPSGSFSFLNKIEIMLGLLLCNLPLSLTVFWPFPRVMKHSFPPVWFLMVAQKICEMDIPWYM